MIGGGPVVDGLCGYCDASINEIVRHYELAFDQADWILDAAESDVDKNSYLYRGPSGREEVGFSVSLDEEMMKSRLTIIVMPQ